MTETRRRPAEAAGPVGAVTLSFRHEDELDGVDDPIGHDLSAIAAAGRTLFCASDETATVECLFLDPDGREYGDHRNVALGEIFDLPDGPDGEMDIEGLAVADGYLWITGSQGLKRRKPKKKDTAFHALSEIAWDRNRGFLGRLPLADHGDGVFVPVADAGPDAGAARRPACLEMDPEGSNILKRQLAKHPILKPYMSAPCKENGFDVEGIEATGSHVFLGLRGPVVGGRAILVETRMKVTKSGVLKPDKFDAGERFHLHALDLDGLGVRDLVIDDGRLLILAGPTLDHDGPQAVFVLDELPHGGNAITIWKPKRVLDLPATPKADKAEGLARIEIAGTPYLLVAYDTPAQARVSDGGRRVTADLFELPRA